MIAFTREDILEGKMHALLAYLSILCIIPLIFRKNNPFVLAHGKQGLVLFVAEVAVFILGIMFPWAYSPLMFLLMAFSFWGIIAVLRGQTVRLPVAASIADKIVL